MNCLELPVFRVDGREKLLAHRRIGGHLAVGQRVSTSLWSPRIDHMGCVHATAQIEHCCVRGKWNPISARVLMSLLITETLRGNGK